MVKWRCIIDYHSFILKAPAKCVNNNDFCFLINRHPDFARTDGCLIIVSGRIEY